MPSPFDAILAGRIAFGAGRLERLDRELAALVGTGAAVLLVSDRGLAAAGVLARAEAALATGGFAVASFSELAGEPAADDVDRVAAAAHRCGAEAIVGIGGGSVLDAAKLAACAAATGRKAMDYALMATPLPEKRPVIVLAPTTAGTGSEMTRTAVFADPRGRKLWAWGDALRADLALLDPALTTALPRGLTVATGVDALVHAIEAATVRRADPIATGFALEAIRLVARTLPRAASAPEDLEARGAMLVAASLAGLAIDQSGTGIAHAIGHALGSIAKVHHGRAVGLSLRAALAWNAEAAVASHAAVAQALGAGNGGRGERALAEAAAPAYADLLERVSLPLSLADHGLSAGDAERLVAASLGEENAPMRENNARKVARADLERLAAAVLSAR